MELIEKFQAAARDADIKAEIVRSLEEFVGEEGVVDFLLSVAADELEYDLARVEVFKILELLERVDVEEYAQIARVICGVLRRSGDVLVKQYAAISVSGYTENEDVVAEVERIVFDSREDLDVRWNVFSAIKANRDREWAIGLLRKLLGVEEFRGAAEGCLGGRGSEGASAKP